MDGMNVKVIRVVEEFYVEKVAIPFEHQELKNEALPEGDKRLSQAGENGQKEVTYRRILEDGREVSNSAVETTIIKAAVPEVMMVGSKSTFTAINIPGKIAYLSAGNAWIIETSTRNRYCVVSSGDLDGRVFDLSEDGSYLLFTRFADGTEQINNLWAVDLTSNPIVPIDLKIENVVHYAEFDAISQRVAFSTVEWREQAPGWQANNDLYEVEILPGGQIGASRQIVGKNSGGVYGWWGTQYSWLPSQAQFLLAQPDGVGIINENDGTQIKLLSILPYQTGGDWAWVPGISWSPDGQVVYTVNKAGPDDRSESGNQEFDLIGLSIGGGSPITLVDNVGMFAYPTVSPVIQKTNFYNDDSGINVEQETFYVAYLQAILPQESETSKYRLTVIDRDGSNKKSLFPVENSAGLDPQRVAWSPTELGIGGNYAIAVIYNGNVWIVDAVTGAAQQITGDGLTSRLDWR
jgi:hypothetical protein